MYAMYWLVGFQYRTMHALQMQAPDYLAERAAVRRSGACCARTAVLCTTPQYILDAVRGKA